MQYQQEGFTLIELIISMAVFMFILVIAAQTFNSIVTQSAKVAKSEENNIEGVIGLEVMRHDLEQMGFGLFWGVTNTVTYNEAVTANWAVDTDNYPKMNDSDDVGTLLRSPRALVGFASFAANATPNVFGDFIGVKGSSVGLSKAAQLWNYIPYQNYSTTTGRTSIPVLWPSNNLVAGDKVIAIRTNFNDPTDDQLLVVDPSSGAFSFNYSPNVSSVSDLQYKFLPTSGLQLNNLYGIDRSTTLRMPFNRADFFVRIPDTSTASTGDTAMPAFCAPGTGILYKATVNHSDGKYTYTPLLDCVANMQVVLGWSLFSGTEKMSVTDTVQVYSSMPSKSDYTASSSTGANVTDIMGWLQDPKGIREHLKLVKIYILVQEGKRDPNYTFPASSLLVGDLLANNGLTQYTYTFSDEQRKYRWKLYKIIVHPKNLVSNQR